MKDLYVWLEYYDNEQVHIGYLFGTETPTKGRMILMCTMHVDNLNEVFGIDKDTIFELTEKPTRIEMSMTVIKGEEDDRLDVGEPPLISRRNS